MQCTRRCPLCANSGHRSPLLNHPVGAADREAFRAIAIRPDRAYITCSTSKQREPTAPSSGNRLGACQAGRIQCSRQSTFAPAAESAEALKHVDVPSEIREFQRSEERFNALAENEDWLANNFDKIVYSEDTPPEEGAAGKPVADEKKGRRKKKREEEEWGSDERGEEEGNEESVAASVSKPNTTKGMPRDT